MHILRMIYTPPPLLFLDRGQKTRGKIEYIHLLENMVSLPYLQAIFILYKGDDYPNVLGKRGEKSGFSVAPWPLTCEHLTLSSSSDHYCIRGKKN